MKNRSEIVCHVHHAIMLMGTPFTLHVQVPVARKHSFDAEQVNKFNLFTHFSLTMSLIKVCVCEDCGPHDRHAAVTTSHLKRRLISADSYVYAQSSVSMDAPQLTGQKHI